MGGRRADPAGRHRPGPLGGDQWGFGWGEFAEYLFKPEILQGVKNTLLLTLAAEALSLSLGTLLAVMRMSQNKIISGASFFYSWLFRSVPLPVLLIFIFFCAAIVPRSASGRSPSTPMTSSPPVPRLPAGLRAE